MNGVLLAAGLDNVHRKNADFLARLAEVKKICAAEKLEIIPQLFSIGYGSAILSYDRNLAEGLPVRDALYVAAGGSARFQSDPPPAFVNGGFEEHDGNKLKGWGMQDQPGVVSFVDTLESKDGDASLRLENFQQPHGHGRVMQAVLIRPNRCYRLS